MQSVHAGLTKRASAVEGTGRAWSRLEKVKRCYVSRTEKDVTATGGGGCVALEGDQDDGDGFDII